MNLLFRLEALSEHGRFSKQCTDNDQQQSRTNPMTIDKLEEPLSIIFSSVQSCHEIQGELDSVSNAEIVCSATNGSCGLIKLAVRTNLMTTDKLEEP